MESPGTKGSQIFEHDDYKQEFLGYASFDPLAYQAAGEVRYVEMLAMLDKAKAEVSKIITGHCVDYLIKKIEHNGSNKN